MNGFSGSIFHVFSNLVVSKKKIHNLYKGRIENPSLAITVCHRAAYLWSSGQIFLSPFE